MLFLFICTSSNYVSHSPLNPHHSPRYKTGCWIKHLLLYGATKPLMNQFHGVDHILSWMAGNHVTSRIWWYLSHIACILAGEAFSIAVSFVKKVALLVQILCHCPWFVQATRTHGLRMDSVKTSDSIMVSEILVSWVCLKLWYTHTLDPL